MRSETSRCLDLVEAALDPVHLARTRQLWEDCRHYRPVPHLPLVCMCPAPDWPQYTMDEIQADMEKMLVSELAHVYAACLVKADTLTVFTRAHQAIDGIPFAPAPTPLGRVCIREDSSVMVSGEMYDTFCKPHAQRLLDEFGGCIHWCGDGKAWWRSLITLRNLTAVNPFQGQYYDPVDMHRACRDTGVMIWQWTTGLTPEQREEIRTGFTLIKWAADIETAKRALEESR
jgi:hypothetical protein